MNGSSEVNRKPFGSGILKVKKILGDGNCCPRSLLDQHNRFIEVGNIESVLQPVRVAVRDFVKKNIEKFEAALFCTALDIGGTVGEAIDELGILGKFVGPEFCHAYGLLHNVRVNVHHIDGNIESYGLLTSNDVLQLYYAFQHYESVVGVEEESQRKAIASRKRKRALRGEQFTPNPTVKKTKIEEKLQAIPSIPVADNEDENSCLTSTFISQTNIATASKFGIKFSFDTVDENCMDIILKSALHQDQSFLIHESNLPVGLGIHLPNSLQNENRSTKFLQFLRFCTQPFA